MGAQWAHGACEDNSMFKLAEKYGLLSNDMERDAFGDMNHESFDLEHVYLKDGVLIPEKLAVIAGEIHTKTCEKLQSLYDDDQDDISPQSKQFCINFDWNWNLDPIFFNKLIDRTISLSKIGCTANVVAFKAVHNFWVRPDWNFIEKENVIN